jgi:hypothetical protein
MRRTFDRFRLLVVSIAGWLNRQQRDAVDYLREENRVLREQLGDKRLRLNDDQPRCLAAKAKRLGRRILREVATTVTPETPPDLGPEADRPQIRWEQKPGPGRPRTRDEIENLIVRMATENRD